MERLSAVEKVVEMFACPNECKKGITMKYHQNNKRIPYTFSVYCNGCGTILLEETIDENAK